jgi:GNAT superfamily N-acetyltransferase
LSDFVPADTKPRYFCHPPFLVPAGGYCIGVEMLAAVGAQLAPLIVQHWEETRPASGKLDVDWGQLIEAERRGRLLTITVRQLAITRHMAGYFIGSLGHPANQKDRLVLTEMGLYVAPAHRRAGLGPGLLRYIEEVARVLDCNRIEMYSLTMKDGRDAGPVYRRLGYQPAAVQYLKDL